MFGRKMRFGILPEISKIPETESDGNIRRSDVAYKLKSKRNHDRRRNVRKSTITVGDMILIKNRRTDPLSPIPGTVVKICGNAVTARFANGKVFIRDKSHFKIVRERLHSKGLESDGEEMKATENTSIQKIRLWDQDNTEKISR